MSKHPVSKMAIHDIRRGKSESGRKVGFLVSRKDNTDAGYCVQTPYVPAKSPLTKETASYSAPTLSGPGRNGGAAHSGDKKAALAKAMELALAAGDELPEGRVAALAWTPEGFVVG